MRFNIYIPVPVLTLDECLRHILTQTLYPFIPAIDNSNRTDLCLNVGELWMSVAFSLSRCPWKTYLAVTFSSDVPTCFITIKNIPPNNLASDEREFLFPMLKQSLAIKPAIYFFISSSLLR